MIVSRRSLLALVLGGFILSACAQEQLIEPQIASGLRVVDVSVDTLEATGGVSFSKEYIAQRFERSISAALSDMGVSASTSANLQIKVKSVYVADAAMGLLLGSSNSGTTVIIQLVDSRTGVVLLEPTQISVSGSQRATVFGALAIGTQEEELELVAAALAQDIKIAIYGE